MVPHFLIVAGEKSGEEHALTFFPQLKKDCPHVHFFGVGGDTLHSEGVELLYHLKDFSGLGITEVIRKVPFYWKALNHLVDEVGKRQCQVALLIDFQEFNYNLAKRLSRKGVKVLYFVAPQAWAWRSYRAKILSNWVHTLFTILPFEKEWFLERGMRCVKAVQHPIMRRFQNYLTSQREESGVMRSFWSDSPRKIKLLLLPGSRFPEVSKLFPLFIQVANQLRIRFPIEVSTVWATHISKDSFQKDLQEVDHIYDSDQLQIALEEADLAIAASGTVTLSLALFQVPTVVCYHISWLGQLFFAQMTDYRGPISLPNIVLRKVVFPELLQEFATVDNILPLLVQWITEKEFYLQTKNELSQLPKLLSGDDFSVAEYITQIINESYGQH